MITLLFKNGLIARTPALPGRPTELTVTDVGHTVLEHAAPTMRSLTQQILRSFRPSMAAAMERALRHMLATLETTRQTRRQ